MTTTILGYMSAAMRRAEYEQLQDGSGGSYAQIPSFEGLWASGPTIEEARAELYDALDGWLIVNYVISKLDLPDVGVQLGAEEKV